MEVIKALLELFPSRAPYLVMLIGLLAILAAIIPFKVNKGGWTLQNPAGKAARLALFAVGVVFVGGSVYAMSTFGGPELTRRTTKHIAAYNSLVTVTGTEADCAAERCQLFYHESVLLNAPGDEPASYEGRIKTGGRIVSFNSSPRAEILNPEQYPANPTYLEFRISPESPDARKLEGQAELVIERTLTPKDGKIGWHLPYETAYVVAILDLRSLGFPIQTQLQPKIETKRADGALVSGYAVPRLNVFQGGRVFVLTATDVPAGSSLYISWKG